MITLVQDGISRKEIKTHRWIFQQNCLIGHKFFNPPFIVTILARPSICSVVSSILPLAIYRCRQYKQGLSRDQVRSKVGTEKIPPLTSQLIKHAIPPIVFSSVGSSSSLLLTHLIVSSLNEKYSALLHIHGTIFELGRASCWTAFGGRARFFRGGERTALLKRLSVRRSLIDVRDERTCPEGPTINRYRSNWGTLFRRGYSSIV